MTQPNFKFQEEYSAKLPALALLTNLGWQFLSPTEALNVRGGKYDQVVLKTAAIPHQLGHLFNQTRQLNTTHENLSFTILF